jgi:hypothetical protein
VVSHCQGDGGKQRQEMSPISPFPYYSHHEGATVPSLVLTDSPEAVTIGVSFYRRENQGTERP